MTFEIPNVTGYMLPDDHPVAMEYVSSMFSSMSETWIVAPSDCLDSVATEIGYARNQNVPVHVYVSDNDMAIPFIASWNGRCFMGDWVSSGICFSLTSGEIINALKAEYEGWAATKLPISGDQNTPAPAPTEGPTMQSALAPGDSSSPLGRFNNQPFVEGV